MISDDFLRCPIIFLRFSYDFLSGMRENQNATAESPSCLTEVLEISNTYHLSVQPTRYDACCFEYSSDLANAALTAHCTNPTCGTYQMCRSRLVGTSEECPELQPRTARVVSPSPSKLALCQMRYNSYLESTIAAAGKAFIGQREQTGLER